MKFFKTKYIIFIFGSLFVVGGLVISNKYLSKSYKEIVTKSGLKILFLKDKNLPYIQFALWFLNSGSNYDYKNKSGLNAMTVNLFEQGAGGLSSEVLQENLDYYGAYFKADASRQFSKFIMGGLSWQAKDLWKIFLKITTEPHLEEKEFKLLKKQLLNSRYQRLDDDPSFVANEVWRRSLFQEGSSIGEPNYGTVTSLKSITLEDVKLFFSDYYLEGQPILTVVGQFDNLLEKEIISSFESHFSKGEEEKQDVITPKKPSFFKLLKKKNQAQSQVVMGFQTITFPKDNPRVFTALTLANTVFGASSINSRLMSQLREKMGLTYGVGSILSLSRDYGLFQLGGATRTESTGLFLKEALSLLKKFQEQGITEEELKKAKPILKNRHLISIETPETYLARLVYYHHYLGADISFLDDYISIINDISLEEVNEAIKKYLTFNNLGIVIYGDPSIKGQLLHIEGLHSLEDLSFKNYFSQELNVKD